LLVSINPRRTVVHAIRDRFRVFVRVYLFAGTSAGSYKWVGHASFCSSMDNGLSQRAHVHSASPPISGVE
jgi:hypothetical protein